MIKKNRVKENFSKSSEEYDKYAKIQKSMALDLVKLLKKFKKFKNVLDIGSGTGVLSEEFLKENNVMAIELLDISKDMIEKSKVKLKKYKGKIDIDFICSDIEKYEFRKKYDLIFSNASFQWIEDTEKTFLKLYEALEKEGILAVASFGEKMYYELKDSFSDFDENEKIVHDFLSLEEIKSRSGKFDLIYEKEDFIEEYYINFLDFLKMIKKTGAVGAEEKRVFLGKEKIEKIEKIYKKRYSKDGKIRVTNHIIYYIFKKGE